MFKYLLYLNAFTIKIEYITSFHLSSKHFHNILMVSLSEDSDMDLEEIDPLPPTEDVEGNVVAAIMFPSRTEVQGVLLSMGFSELIVARAMRFFNSTYSIEDMVEQCLSVEHIGKIPNSLIQGFENSWTFIGSHVTYLSYLYRVAEVDRDFGLVHLIPHASGLEYDWQDVGQSYLNAKWVHISNSYLKWRTIRHVKQDIAPDAMNEKFTMPPIRIKIPRDVPSIYRGMTLEQLLERVTWSTFSEISGGRQSEWAWFLHLVSRVSPYARKPIFRIKSPSFLRAKRFRSSIMQRLNRIDDIFPNANYSEKVALGQKDDIDNPAVIKLYDMYWDYVGAYRDMLQKYEESSIPVLGVKGTLHWTDSNQHARISFVIHNSTLAIKYAASMRRELRRIMVWFSLRLKYSPEFGCTYRLHDWARETHTFSTVAKHTYLECDRYGVKHAFKWLLPHQCKMLSWMLSKYDEKCPLQKAYESDTTTINLEMSIMPTQFTKDSGGIIVHPSRCGTVAVQWALMRHLWSQIKEKCKDEEENASVYMKFFVICCTDNIDTWLDVALKHDAMICDGKDLIFTLPFCMESREGPKIQIRIIRQRDFTRACMRSEVSASSTVIIDDAHAGKPKFWGKFLSSEACVHRTFVFTKQTEFTYSDFGIMLTAAGISNGREIMQTYPWFKDTPCGRRIRKDFCNSMMMICGQTIVKDTMPSAVEKCIKPFSRSLMKKTIESQRSNKRKISEASKIMHLASFDPRLVPMSEYSVPKKRLCKSDVYEQRPEDVVKYLNAEDKPGMKTAAGMIENIGSKKENCCICLDTMESAVITNCHHLFCKSCISQSLKSGNRKCPQCRQAITVLKELNDMAEPTGTVNGHVISHKYLKTLNRISAKKTIPKVRYLIERANAVGKVAFYSRYREIVKAVCDEIKRMGCNVIRITRKVKQTEIDNAAGPLVVVLPHTTATRSMEISGCTELIVNEPFINGKNELHVRSRFLMHGGNHIKTTVMKTIGGIEMNEKANGPNIQKNAVEKTLTN